MKTEEPCSEARVAEFYRGLESRLGSPTRARIGREGGSHHREACGGIDGLAGQDRAGLSEGNPLAPA